MTPPPPRSPSQFWYPRGRTAGPLRMTICRTRWGSPSSLRPPSPQHNLVQFNPTIPLPNLRPQGVVVLHPCPHPFTMCPPTPIRRPPSHPTPIIYPLRPPTPHPPSPPPPDPRPVVLQPTPPTAPAILGLEPWWYGLLQLTGGPVEAAADLIHQYICLLERFINVICFICNMLIYIYYIYVLYQ